MLFPDSVTSTIGGIYRGLAALVAIEAGEVHAPFQQPGDSQAPQKSMLGDQIPGVVPIAIPLTAPRPSVWSHTRMGAHLILQEPLQQGFEAQQEAGGDFAPDCGLDIFSDLLYTFGPMGTERLRT